MRGAARRDSNEDNQLEIQIYYTQGAHNQFGGPLVLPITQDAARGSVSQ